MQPGSEHLRRCHRALQFVGATHSYTAEEWLPVVCDRAGELLESARLKDEPPRMVREAQDVISWLSRSLIDLDR